jgi:hypothetical protein
MEPLHSGPKPLWWTATFFITFCAASTWSRRTAPGCCSDLGVVSADPGEQGLDEVPDSWHRGVDAGNDLRDDHQPRVNVQLLEAFLEGRLDVRSRAVVEPQRQQPQNVLHQ